MRGTSYPLKSIREFWSARTATRIARRLTAINIREATTKDTFLTKLRCILLHSVRMTQKSPLDPQDHTYNNSIQQKIRSNARNQLIEIQVKHLMPVMRP